MKQHVPKTLSFNLLLIGLLASPLLVQAQFFTQPGNGDLVAGYRKTGTHQGTNELVAFLINVTNLLTLSPGATITMNNVPAARLTDAFTSDYTFLQWSVFGANYNPSNWSTPLGNFPVATVWYTLPRTNQSVQTVPKVRYSKNNQTSLGLSMASIGSGATSIGSQLPGGTNVNNNTILVREPVQSAYTAFLLSAAMGDQSNPSLGDFGGSVFNFSVEQITPSPFSSSVILDLYESAPAAGVLPPVTYVDPITGSTTSVYYVGYFTLQPSGTLTFTRATAAPPAPTISSVSPTPTVGSSFAAPLTIAGGNFVSGCTVLFTNRDTLDTSSPAVTFNSASSLSVSNVFGTVPHNWNVTVVNPGNSASTPFPFSVTAPSQPVMSVPVINVSGTQVTLSGVNGTGSYGYLVLGSSNLNIPVSQWTKLQTNTFAPNGSFSTSIPVNPANPQYFYRIQP
jgi:hypothetical protein